MLATKVDKEMEEMHGSPNNNLHMRRSENEEREQDGQEYVDTHTSYAHSKGIQVDTKILVEDMGVHLRK